MDRAVRDRCLGHAPSSRVVAARSKSPFAGERVEFSFFDDAFSRGPLPSGLGEGRYDRRGCETCAGRPGGDWCSAWGCPDQVVLHERLKPLMLPWTTVVHPRATLGPNVRLGEGTYVAAGAIVTLNVRIGRMVTINMHCQVAHETVQSGQLSTLHPDVHPARGTYTLASPSSSARGVLRSTRDMRWGRRGAWCRVPWRSAPCKEIVATLGFLLAILLRWAPQGPQLFGNRSEGSGGHVCSVE